MYSTIVTGHPTIIRHSIPQPKGVGVNPDTAKAFALTEEATKLAEKMKKGSYSVPVKIESYTNNGNDNGSLEVPNFIQSKETLLNEKKNENEPRRFLLDNFTNDANMLLNNLENKNDKNEKISSCK
jgi:hypothetical protein